MDAGLINQQKGAESSASSATLSAQQFYQHDPLLMMLKDKLRLNDFWIIAGVMLFPAGVFLSGWLLWINKVQFWTLSNTLGALLLTFVVFPLLFLIYLLVPSSIASLFNTLSTNGVIGERQLVTWTDRGWWTAATLVILVFYVCYRLLLIETRISSPVPYWFRVSLIVTYLPLMYAVCISVVSSDGKSP